MLNAFLIVIYLVLTVSGLVIFKLGTSNNFTFGMINGNIELKFNLLVIVGLCCYILSFLLYMYIISKFNLSYIVPLTTGIVYVCIYISSIIIFKESSTPLNIIGVMLVLLGVVLLNIKK